MLETALVDYLGQRPDLAALVAARVYKVWLPTPVGGGAVTLPAVTLQKAGETPSEHQGGASSLGDARIRFSAWARGYDEAKEVGEALRLALLALATGGVIGRADRPVSIVHVRHVGDYDDPEGPYGGAAPQIHQVVLDFDIRYRQAVPEEE